VHSCPCPVQIHQLYIKTLLRNSYPICIFQVTALLQYILAKVLRKGSWTCVYSKIILLRCLSFHFLLPHDQSTFKLPSTYIISEDSRCTYRLNWKLLPRFRAKCNTYSCRWYSPGLVYLLSVLPRMCGMWSQIMLCTFTASTLQDYPKELAHIAPIAFSDSKAVV